MQLLTQRGVIATQLWREWEANASRITFIILNPSRADAEMNEPTIRRCLNFDRGWG